LFASFFLSSWLRVVAAVRPSLTAHVFAHLATHRIALHRIVCIASQVKEEEREIRILVLGLDNAGKTTIVRKLCGKPIDSIEPTLGFSIQTLEYDLRSDGCAQDYSSPSTSYQLHLWDIGGQSTIRAYWRNYFEKTDGIIWVVDSGDRRRLRLVQKELNTVLEQERLAGASLLVLANKSDLEGSLGPEAIAKALELNETKDGGGSGNNNNHDNNNNNHDNDNDNDSGRLGEKPNHSSRHWTIRASSAVTGEGLAESIEWLVRDITDRIYFAA
jgi:ADP-ribosylation factor-like protein 2